LLLGKTFIAVNLPLIADGSQEQLENLELKEVTQESLSFSGEADLLASHLASWPVVERGIRYRRHDCPALRRYPEQQRRRRQGMLLPAVS